jgi:LAS superfamily LD-carboxypeptidase LdcB
VQAAAQPAATVDARAVDLAGRGATALPADYVRRALDTPGLAKAVAGARAKVDSGPEAARNTRLDVQARALLKAVETAFILDPNASTLDLLPEPERSHFKNFAWDENDYPGGPEGPHEDEALALDAALAKIRPERRANSTPTAVVTRAQFNEEVWKYIQAQERPIPGQEQRKLNRYAEASFVLMRDAAKKDGVDIFILSANRDPAVAARNAERTGNAYAVASFSSHILGLAMDLRMSQGAQKYDEASTRPMTNIIAMRSSPVHKWLFVRGAPYGWFPYTHEPWHWEYNPMGFRQRFWKDFPGGMPEGQAPAGEG